MCTHILIKYIERYLWICWWMYMVSCNICVFLNNAFQFFYEYNSMFSNRTRYEVPYLPALLS